MNPPLWSAPATDFRADLPPGKSLAAVAKEMKRTRTWAAVKRDLGYTGSVSALQQGCKRAAGPPARDSMACRIAPQHLPCAVKPGARWYEFVDASGNLVCLSMGKHRPEALAALQARAEAVGGRVVEARGWRRQIVQGASGR